VPELARRTFSAERCPEGERLAPQHQFGLSFTDVSFSTLGRYCSPLASSLPQLSSRLRWTSSKSLSGPQEHEWNLEKNSCKTVFLGSQDSSFELNLYLLTAGVAPKRPRFDPFRKYSIPMHLCQCVRTGSAARGHVFKRPAPCLQLKVLRSRARSPGNSSLCTFCYGRGRKKVCDPLEIHTLPKPLQGFEKSWR
jgi:hypothetical protein